MSLDAERSELSRREVVALGIATSAVALGVNEARADESRSRATAPRLRTAICDLFGIDHPVVQAPMGGVAGPELVAAVSNAGGLGVLAGVGLPPDELRSKIRAVRALTNRPFGVNLLMHTAMLAPADVSKIDADTVTRVQAQLNHFRQQLGIEPHTDRPPQPPSIVDQ